MNDVAIYAGLVLLGGGLIVALVVGVWLVSDATLWHSDRGGRLLRTGLFGIVAAALGLGLGLVLLIVGAA